MGEVGQGDLDRAGARVLEHAQALRGTTPSPPASTPSPRKLQGTPIVSPSARPESAAVKSGTSTVALVASWGSWPNSADADERQVRDAAREGPDLVERRREGDEAVAADAAVGRLQADDAAERGRLPDGAAGVGAERHGRQPAATAAAEPPDEPPGTRAGSQGLRVGLYALFSVDEPIANSSMFVLPTSTAPAASRRATAVAVNGGR